MAKIDLTGREWCDMVFDGRNKAYGAYELREHSPKRHMWSVIIVLILAFFAFIIPTLIRLATPKQKVVMTEVTSLSKLKQADVKQKEMKKIQDEPTPPQAVKSSVKFTAPVIKKDEEVNEDEEIKSQAELMDAKGSISIADVKGNDEVNGKDIADLKQIVTQAAPEEKVFEVVEQMPTFPGGQDALFEYLQKHIKYPTIAEENGIQGRVIVTFVVEKDGSITDITVVKSQDPSLDKEAKRVIGTMPKWIPGKQNGSAVRVKFTVPVTFRLQ
jgi:periplasmic protein TonB